MKTLVFQAAVRLNVKPPRVFGLAFEYYEHFIPKKKVLRIFYKWANKNINNTIVEDYCLEVLANRATPIQ